MAIDEVDSLGPNGPAGGSIAAIGFHEVIGIVSTFVLRDLIQRVEACVSSRPGRPSFGWQSGARRVSGPLSP